MNTKIDNTKTLKVLTSEEINKLFMPGEVGVILDYQLFDTKTGKPTSIHVIKKSESFLKGFLQLLYVTAVTPDTANPVALIDTGNTSRDIYQMYQDNANRAFNVNGAVNTDTHGIVVGTGNTAPTISDYALQTKIAHGVVGGQLQYSATTYGAPANDATTAQYTITRNFANGSGGAITVNEIGLYSKAKDTSGTGRIIAIIRDVIGGGIAVPNGQTLTVNYRPQTVI